MSLFAINRVILTNCRLTKDGELGYTKGGTASLKLSVAWNDSKKNAAGQYEKYANFFDVQVWGKAAEALAAKAIKGARVDIEGRIEQQRWESQEGEKRSKIVIQADKCIIDSKEPARSESTGGNQKEFFNAATDDMGGIDTEEWTDGEIPF